MTHLSEDLPADIQDYMSTLAELNIFLTGKTGIFFFIIIFKYFRGRD